MNPYVIFIGAGPIGLLAAIQLKLQFPELEILMFEKYEEPVRKHSMYASQSSFAGMDTSKGFGEVLNSISSKIMISDLETLLRNHAVYLGINIKYQEIKDFNDLVSEYPDTKYFIGSGGLKGIIHPQVFDSENQINELLKYAVEVKYKAVGSTQSLSKLTELPMVLSKTHHTVSEYVGHLKEGQTPVSLRIFIDKPTWEAMQGATYKKPFTLQDTDKIPGELLDTIRTYLDAREELVNESIQEGSLKISAITLSLYTSKEFCKKMGEKIIFKIGEEAFACPFYRSFNDNAACIPFFTKAMKALIQETPVEVSKISASFFSSSAEEDPLEYYQNEIQNFVDKEIRIVYCLNAGIDALETSVASSQKLEASSSSCTLL